MTLRLYLLAGTIAAFALTAGWAYAERLSRQAAEARIDQQAATIAELQLANAAKQKAIEANARLAEDASRAAAVERNRRIEAERRARLLIDEFRAAETEPVPDPEPEDNADAPTTPRADCVCRFTPGERSRVLDETPVRRPVRRPDPADGLGSDHAVP